jgi:hypothetical protein
MAIDIRSFTDSNWEYIVTKAGSRRALFHNKDILVFIYLNAAEADLAVFEDMSLAKEVLPSRIRCAFANEKHRLRTANDIQPQGRQWKDHARLRRQVRPWLGTSARRRR